MCVYAQLCPTLCSPSLPGSSVHGIFKARILEQVAISSSRSSPPRDQTHVSRTPALAGGCFTTEPPVKPMHAHARAHTHTRTHTQCEHDKKHSPCSKFWDL